MAWIVSTTLLALMFCATILLWRPWSFKRVHKRLSKHDKIVMMGAFLKDDAKRRLKSQAYKQPEKTMAEMNSYLWSVPLLPTPFVGDAPAPGRYGTANINRQQFRHPCDVAMPKPKDLYRIFFTGASTAFSSGAPDDSTTITGYLQEMLNLQMTPKTGQTYEVVNAATPGWASTQERLWIELRLVELDPDMIIQYSGNNEVHWGALRYRTDWMRTYSGHLYWTMIDSLYRYFRHEALVDVSPREPGRVDSAQMAATLSKNVYQCIALLEKRKVPYIFILHPTIAASAKQLSDREKAIHDKDSFGPQTAEYFRSCYGHIRAALQQLKKETDARHFSSKNFYYFDHSDVFDKMDQTEEIFLDAYHFGDRGNEYLAKRILKDLAPVLT